MKAKVEVNSRIKSIDLPNFKPHEWEQMRALAKFIKPRHMNARKDKLFPLLKHAREVF